MSLFALGNYCNDLEVLKLQGCENISDEGCIVLSRGCRKLRNLNLRGVPDLTEASSGDVRGFAKGKRLNTKFFIKLRMSSF